MKCHLLHLANCSEVTLIEKCDLWGSYQSFQFIINSYKKTKTKTKCWPVFKAIKERLTTAWISLHNSENRLALQHLSPSELNTQKNWIFVLSRTNLSCSNSFMSHFFSLEHSLHIHKIVVIIIIVTFWMSSFISQNKTMICTSVQIGDSLSIKSLQI